MKDFHDFLIDENIGQVLGWSVEAQQISTNVIHAGSWEDLKRKIMENRENSEILAFKPESEELARRAAEQSKIDILLMPQKTSKRNLNHVIAEEAKKNSVYIAFDLSNIHFSNKPHKIMAAWRKELKILEKQGAPYMASTNAETCEMVRPPRDLSALINQLGGDGKAAVKETPSNLMEEIKRRKRELRTGVEKI